MSDYTRILLRQGLNQEKDNVILKSGEPAYVTDYKRIVIGDGTTGGGVSIGSKFLGFVRFDDFSSEVEGANPGYPGDFIFETDSNLLYVLSGTDTILGKEAYQIKTNYIPINRTPTPDNITIFNNRGVLSVVQDSIDARYLASFSIGRGLSRNPTNPSILELRQPSPELSFQSGVLQITDGGVGNVKLAAMRPNTVKARLNLSGPPDDITLDELKFALGLISESGDASIGVPVGTIIDFAGVNPPPSYLPCDGRELSILQFLDLYDAIGNTWGAPTLTSFNLPNLNKRATIGKGALSATGFADQISESVGSYGGSVNNRLTVRQLPPHTHGVTFSIPAHAHTIDITLPEFSGVFESGNFVVNGYNNFITIIGGNGPQAAPRTIPSGPTDKLTLTRKKAGEVILQQKRYIQERTIKYVLDKYPVALSGNNFTQTDILSSKCFRDTGYIVDSIAADISNNANHRSVETGNLYFSGYIASFQNNSTVPALPANQVIPTIDAIESIGSIIAGINMPVESTGFTNNGVLSSSEFLQGPQRVVGEGFNNFTNVIANSSFVPVTTPNGLIPDNSFIIAGDILNQFKPYLQEKVVDYVQVNFPYALSGLGDFDNFTLASQLSSKCFRDTGFIIDSLAADIKNNANHRSIETGVFYFSGALLRNGINEGSEVPTLPEDQVMATVKAISALGSYITGISTPLVYGNTVNGVLSTNSFFTSAQNAILDGINTFTLVTSNSTVNTRTSPRGVADASYGQAADLILASKELLQQQILDYALFNYSFALEGSTVPETQNIRDLFYRDVGFVVNSISEDIRINVNHRSVDTSKLVLDGDLFKHQITNNFIDAVVGSVSAIGIYIQGTNVETPPDVLIPGPILSNSEVEPRVVDMWSKVITVINPLLGPGVVLDYDPPGTPVIGAATVTTLINGERGNIANKVVNYIQEQNYISDFLSLSGVYASEIEFTINKILDSTVKELNTGVKSSSLVNAYAFLARMFDTLSLTDAERLDVLRYLFNVLVETFVSFSNSVSNLAIKKILTLIETIIYPFLNQGRSLSYEPPGYTIQVRLDQDASGQLPFSPEGIDGIIESSELDALTQGLLNVQISESIFKENLRAASFILELKPTIQTQVTNYVIRRGYLEPESDLLEKCRRDIGFMLDAIANDLATGVNAKSVQYAVAYWDGSTSRLPENLIPNQRNNTIDTIDYLRSVVLGYLSNYSIINQVVQLSRTISYPLKNNGKLLPYVPEGPPITADRQTAAQVLRNNRTTLQNQTILFVRTLNIINDRPDLQSKCFRDIGYMVDAVVNDLETGVNARSIQYGLAYWDGNRNRIGGNVSGVNTNVDQRQATIETIKFLREKSIELIIAQGGSVGGSVTNTKTTSLSGGFNFNGQTTDGRLFGLNGDSINNMQPSAVVSKCIKVR